MKLIVQSVQADYAVSTSIASTLWQDSTPSLASIQHAHAYAFGITLLHSFTSSSIPCMHAGDSRTPLSNTNQPTPAS